MSRSRVLKYATNKPTAAEPMSPYTIASHRLGGLTMSSAADNHDDESLQYPVDPHGMVDADERTEQHPARRGHAGADGEGAGVDPRDRDAHGLRHHAVLHGGADPDAILAVFQKQPKGADDGRRERGDQQPVPGIFEIEEREITGERLLDLACHGTELPERVVLQHQRNAKRGQNGREGIAAEQWT